MLHGGFSHFRKKTPGKRYIAGSLAGFVATSLTYPLDTAKVSASFFTSNTIFLKARLSISKKSEYSGLVDVIVKSYRIDGPLALYRLVVYIPARILINYDSLYSGIYSTLAGVVPYAGSSFYTFETLKLLYTEEFGRSPSAPMIMLFGATAGLIGQSCSYPLDIVRRRMQTGRAPAGMGLLALLSHIAREEGIRALYKGLSMNWLKGPISVGVSFTTYNFSFPYLSSFSQCH